MEPRERVKILLVDDQPGKLLSLEAILSDLDEQIVKANSADEALKILLSQDIAIVLVDVCMPNMDGFELAALIRDHPRFRRTAIIFISAVHLTDADRLRGYTLGAVDYIPVPIIPDVLKAKVAVFADLYRKTLLLERLNAELKQRVEELDRTNERLRVADRMATIGTLAAGLGHDMGNLLLPIRMRLDTLEACDLPEAAREDVAAIRDASGYLQRLARTLRLLSLDSADDMPEDAPTDLAAWWQESEGMIRGSVPRGAVLEARVPEGLPPAKIGRTGLSQIVFNLVHNAGDALAGRTDGRIVVSAEASTGSPCTVTLRVADNGPGMTEEAKRRCLEPFYTTKTRELSTGLGLALVGGIVKRAAGSIQIQSEPGKGATFLVQLPAEPPTAAVKDTSTRGATRRAVAAVTVADARLLAHVRSILGSMEFQIRPDPTDEADVWVTQPDGNGAMLHAAGFASSRPDRLVLVLGADAPADGPPQVVYLGSDCRPSVLRARIQEALGAPRPIRSGAPATPAVPAHAEIA